MRRYAAMVGIVATGAMALAGGGGRVSGEPPAKQIVLTPLGVYRTLLNDKAAAEIAAYDPATRRVFSVNVELRRIDVLDISDPANPFLASTIDVTPFGHHANSVAVHDGIIGVAIQAEVKTDPGKAAFFDADGNLLAAVTAGALPDMITFTPNGRFALVANEGEPNDAYTVDPQGTISLIDLTGGVNALTDADVTSIDFTAFNGAALDPSVRIFGPGASVAQDLEPEYIAVSHDSRTAWVTLQENNAIAIVDLSERRVTRVVGLGFKDHTAPGNGLDASDQGGAINITNWPLWGMYQPDAIAAFEYHGRTYLATANEGDVREYAGFPGGVESARVNSLTLDPIAFPNAAALKANTALGRVNVTKSLGDPDRDGDFDQLFAFGARSFSIRDAQAGLLFDSGDALERVTAAASPANFNASNTNNTLKNRSDDKGPEPEGIRAAALFGRTYLFIALERIGGIAVYEVVNPAAPTFVQYINTRNFAAATTTVAAGDLGPEGVIVIPADDSPTGQPLLVIANEVSGTIRIFGISQAK